MALLNDIVQDTTATTGTGSYTLSGVAPTGRQTFAAAVGVGNKVYYRALDTAGNWEIGIGTLSATTTLARTTILASSNANAAVNWLAGTKTIINILPSSKAVYEDENNQIQLLAGSAAAPALTWVSNVVTGLYQAATNAIGFAINGSERARLTATGLGLGGTATTLLDVFGIGRARSLRNGLNALGTVSGGTLTIDASYDVTTVILGANVGTTAFTNAPTSGDTQTIVLRVSQDATGSRTIAWPSSVYCEGGSRTTNLAPLSAANAITLYTLTSFDGGTIWYAQRLNTLAFANS